MTAALILAMIPAAAVPAGAKTSANGETVNTVLFYAKDSGGTPVLVSQIPVMELAEDNSGLSVHNYSLLDRYVTTVHQEATGLTVPEFVEYATGKTKADGIAGLHFTGTDQIAFWEIDQTGYDDMDTYTYEDLYGVPRYNFPELYKYWNYRTQDYYDPDGVMSREEAIDYIFEHGEPEQMIMSVTAFSQRYIVTDEKYDEEDYNLENYWSSLDLLDTERTVRLMIPMTEQDLREKRPTASNTRFWVSQIMLEEDGGSSFTSSGTVAEPTARLTEDSDNYYIRFRCATEGAVIYYNHNFQSPSYMPTCPYEGGAVTIPKSAFPRGTVNMTVHAVKDGWADAGVITLNLTPEGNETGVQTPAVVCGEGGQAVLSDDGEKLTITPDEGWDVSSVKLNGAEQGAVTTLENLWTGDTVEVAFVKKPDDTPVPKTFTDVPADAWYASAVAFVSEKGYFNGTSETEFSPNLTMTRAKFVTVLGRIAGIDQSQYTGSDFLDVPEGKWYSACVKWASENDIVNGIGGGLFNPDGQVTREQMAAIMYRYAAFCGLDMQADDTKYLSFGDRDQVSAYARTAMIWAVDRGLINGTGEGLEPRAQATRAQVAQIVVNYSNKVQS